MFQLNTVLTIHKMKFIDVAFLLYCTCLFFIYRTIMFYTTVSLIKYLCMCLLVVAITIETASMGHSMSNHQVISTDLLKILLKFGTLVGIV